MKRGNKTWLIVIISMLIIGVLSFGAYKLITTQLASPDLASVSKNWVDKGVTMEDMANRRYITDCNYTGPFAYPEVYDIPFEQTEEYIKNKDLDDAVKAPAVETAQMFFEALLDTAYRDIQENPKEYQQKIDDYAVQSVIMNGIFPLVEDNAYPIDEMAETVGDYFVLNRVEQEDEFVTNESLVYGEVGSIWVRGMLKNVIHSSDDPEVTLEEEHLTGFDVMLEKDNSSPTGWAVSGIFRTDMLKEGSNE